MTIRRANQTAITKATLLTLTTTVVDPPAILTVTEEIYEDYTSTDGGFEKHQRLLFYPGQRIESATIDGLFGTADITSVLPASGPAAGGTNLTIKGTRLSGSTACTVGGVATTNFRVVDDSTITCTTGAHAAGAVSTVVTDDAGAVTEAASFTYV